ncbi:hypothetical protein [Nannocystis pusilla]|uniref:RHS repeat protein n=1 Tax=Nannocystis pusilla TaxID=889268 RepID=A0ABS7U5R0_9BACT|nr:hypothetical protein [Nannocystis pusilla]MBZ5715890.1 hypothetical protein [Nannocystis pusilla]
MHHRADGETTEYTYGFFDGALASAVVTAGAGPATWRYGHDDEGRLASVEVPVEVCVPGSPCHASRCRFTYERGGRLRTYVCDAGHPGRFEHDQAGRLVSATRGVENSYHYDDQGRLVAIERSSEPGAMERLTYQGRCPASLVRRFASGVDPMALVDEPPRPELWPDEMPVR